MPVMWVIIAD